MTCPVFTTDLKSLIVEGRRITQENHGDALFPGEHDEIVGRVGWVGRVLGRLGVETPKNHRFGVETFGHFFWEKILDQVADVSVSLKFLKDFLAEEPIRRMIPAKKMDDDLVTWPFTL